MKKNKNIFMASVLLLSLGLASCTDSFLDVTSKTESSTGTFYKTEKDAYRALIGCYDGWRQTSSAMMVGFYMASEVMSAECFGATGNADGRGYQAIDRFDISQSPADLNLYEGDWKNYYAGVYRCNELIAHEEQIVWNESDSKRGIYMGECRTLRALLYLDMVRLWGNIPSASLSDAFAPEVFYLQKCKKINLHKRYYHYNTHQTHLSRLFRSFFKIFPHKFIVCISDFAVYFALKIHLRSPLKTTG